MSRSVAVPPPSLIPKHALVGGLAVTPPRFPASLPISIVVPHAVPQSITPAVDIPKTVKVSQVSQPDPIPPEGLLEGGDGKVRMVELNDIPSIRDISSVSDLKKLKVADLRAMCVEQGVSSQGKKKQLVDRLYASL